MTFGSPRAHLTVSAGKPFALEADGDELGPILLSVSANLRASKHLAFVTENWIIPDDNETMTLLSGAARFMGEHIAVDVGLIFAEGGEVPMPWLDFTYNWD